jgi:hypothetical protein
MVEAMPERYRDSGGRWTYTRISYFSIAYNTKLVLQVSFSHFNHQNSQNSKV